MSKYLETLLTACEGLSKAMVAQRRCFNDIER